MNYWFWTGYYLAWFFGKLLFRFRVVHRERIDGWIANPQALKPGSRMPAVPLSNEQLHQVVRYVSSLR